MPNKPNKLFDNLIKKLKEIEIEPLVPCYIFKENLILIKLSSLDFSFMVEDNISNIII